MGKLSGKIEAVEAFVRDSDEHPEITLAMFRRELDEAVPALAEAVLRFRICPDLGGFDQRMMAAQNRVVVLARGLAALAERTMEAFDEDTWRDYVRDCHEADEAEDEPGPEAEVDCCLDHGPQFAGRCHECEHNEWLIDWAIEERAFGGGR